MKRAAIIACALALGLGCGKSDKKKDEASGTPTPVEAAPDTDEQPKPGDNSAGGGTGGEGDRGSNPDRVGDNEPPPPPATVQVVGAGPKPIAIKVGEGEGNLESPDGDPGKGWHVRDILGDKVPADASPALVLHSADESLDIPKGVLRDPKQTLFVKLNRRGVVRFRWFDGKELKGELRGLDRIEIKK